MARKVNQVLRDEWRKRIQRQQQSGLTVAEFCHREEVSAATYYGWKRKLRVRRSPQIKEAAGRSRVGSLTRRQGKWSTV